jgi:murein endopeptidase
MPEGDGWTLRPGRRRAWGTRLAVTTLVDVLRAYHSRYPDGPPIAVGELARRKGGRVDPHAAHRTGRDVDLGYVLTVAHPADRFLRASAENLDVERTWFVVRTLLRMGEVQKIFMSATVQRLLLRHARQSTPTEELSRYFAAANPDPGAITLIRHRRRHVNHMHVRFRCAPENPRCRASPIGPP